jgi:hypothetical protein
MRMRMCCARIIKKLHSAHVPHQRDVDGVVKRFIASPISPQIKFN